MRGGNYKSQGPWSPRGGRGGLGRGGPPRGWRGGRATLRPRALRGRPCPRAVAAARPQAGPSPPLAGWSSATACSCLPGTTAPPPAARSSAPRREVGAGSGGPRADSGRVRCGGTAWQIAGRGIGNRQWDGATRLRLRWLGRTDKGHLGGSGPRRWPQRGSVWPLSIACPLGASSRARAANWPLSSGRGTAECPHATDTDAECAAFMGVGGSSSWNRVGLGSPTDQGGAWPGDLRGKDGRSLLGKLLSQRPFSFPRHLQFCVGPAPSDKGSGLGVLACFST